MPVSPGPPTKLKRGRRPACPAGVTDRSHLRFLLLSLAPHRASYLFTVTSISHGEPKPTTEPPLRSRRVFVPFKAARSLPIPSSAPNSTRRSAATRRHRSEI